jgi:hypothetical protein
MKYLYPSIKYLLSLLILLSSISASSQDCQIDFSYVNTGANMIVMINGAALENDILIPGDSLGVFILENESWLCVGAIEWDSSQQTIAIWGDDNSTTEIDGYSSLQQIEFIAMSGGAYYTVDYSPQINFQINGLAILGSELTLNPLCTEMEYNLGCTDQNYDEYDENATVDDGSCVTDLINLQDCQLDFSYTNTGSNMIVMINGGALENDVLTPGDSFGAFIWLNDSWLCVGAIEWDSTQQTIAIWGDDSSSDEIDGYIPSQAIEFFAKSGGVIYAIDYSPTINFQINGLAILGSELALSPLCNAPVDILGCTETNAFNYNDYATYDDGSCIDIIIGCLEESAFNYNINANTNDDSCIEIIYGCTDSSSFNYNPNANV